MGASRSLSCWTKGSNGSYTGYYDNIRCNENKMVSAVMSCFCVTGSNSELCSGYCFYNCEQHTNIHKISNKVDLNKYMCGRFNRTGISCGECNNGTSPFVLSYNMSCVECSGGHKNWWKFALVGFVPLTNFYFLIVFLKINVISSRLHGLVLFSQVVSAPALIRLTFVALRRHQSLLKVVKIAEPF